MKLEVTMYGPYRHFSDHFPSMETFSTHVLDVINQSLTSDAPNLSVIHSPRSDIGNAHICWTRADGKIIKGRAPIGIIEYDIPLENWRIDLVPYIGSSISTLHY